MKKYLRRFFFIRSSYRFGDIAKLFDFDVWDYPRPDDYPTRQEKQRAWDKLLKLGEHKLKEREKYALRTRFEENKEEQNESIYDVLSSVGHRFGWTLPEYNFRYILIFEPDLKEFWRWTGLDVDENLKFFLSRAVPSYEFARFYGREYKIPEYSLFDKFRYSDYTEIKNELIRVGVSKKCFKLIEDYYIYYIQLPEIIKTLSRIIRPLFFVAHFLEKEDPAIYDYHRRLIEFYLSAIESGNEWLRRWVISEIRQLIFRDFLFDSVWQDFLFDRRRYLEKPKLRKGGKGRPPKIVDYKLVYLVKSELKKYEMKLCEPVDLTTAKVINFLMREKRFEISRRHKVHHYNLGAENVRRIYRRAQNLIERETRPERN
jgi:hypothetical protein